MLSNLISFPKRQKFSLEFQVLLALLRQFIHKKPDAELLELCSRSPDWQQVLRLIQEHRVVGHVSNGVKYQLSVLPEDFYCKLLRIRRVQRLKSMNQIQVLSQIKDIFDAAETPFVALKGPALSLEIFGDPTLRMSADLDLIVHPGDLIRADRVMQKAGFIREKPHPQVNQGEL